MTPPSTPRRALAVLTRSRAAGPALVLVAAVLVVGGLVATATDHVRLAVATILLVQATLLALLALGRARAAEAQRAVQDRLEQSDARVLGDLARLRQVLLTELDQRGESR